jgi:hypothetical protein
MFYGCLQVASRAQAAPIGTLESERLTTARDLSLGSPCR